MITLPILSDFIDSVCFSSKKKQKNKKKREQKNRKTKKTDENKKRKQKIHLKNIPILL